MSPDPPPLHVCVEARLVSGKAGGVETVLIGLAQGFSELRDDSLRFTFLVYRGAYEWLRPYLEPGWGVVESTAPFAVRWAPLLGPFFRPARALLRLVRRRSDLEAPIPALSDGTAEATGADVMHFPFQVGFLTSLPTIYHPHDLQHRHLPQFFSPEQHAYRERMYGAMCRRADAVVVGTTWVKDDLMEQMDVPAERIHVVPLAPVGGSASVPLDDQVREVTLSFGLGHSYALYPAAMWPHKNHISLIQAAAALKREGIVVPLVFTGAPTEHDDEIRTTIRRQGLADQVTLAGFVTPLELECLYRAARLVVVPTLFEAASFPVWEAFRLGVPVACSSVTSLPQQVRDAAVLFDPTDVKDISAGIRSLWEDHDLRARLVERGSVRASQFTWLRTAQGIRAVYRSVAGRPLSDDDREMLTSAPII